MKWQPFIVSLSTSIIFHSMPHYNLTFCREGAKKNCGTIYELGHKSLYSFFLLQRAPFHVFMAQFIIETFLPYKDWLKRRRRVKQFAENYICNSNKKLLTSTSYASFIPYFCLLVFGILITLVAWFFLSVCSHLAHLALQNVNKYYIIFS